MKLEIIVFDKESALQAEKGGATQLELVTDLEHNGLTPDIETIKEVVSNVEIPVHVMLRPSDTFQHTDKEIKEMVKLIKEYKKLNVSGIVYGSLDEEKKVNIKQLKKIKKVCGDDIKLIFHRAADFARCPIEAWMTLQEQGVKHILTSGGPGKAIDNLDMINMAKKFVEDVLIGSGVSIDNASTIIKETQIKNLHVGSAVWSKPEVIDANKVKLLRKKLL